MKKFIIPLMSVIIVNTIVCASSSNPEAETAAVAVAKDWLTLVDSERYGESWDEAAQYFKTAVPR